MTPAPQRPLTGTALLLPVTLALCIGTGSVLGAPGETQPARPTNDAGEETTVPGGEHDAWIDERHHALQERADALATWTDDFFGHARSVQDSPRSVIRIRPQFEWDEKDGNDWKIRATGRLYLPKASDRLSVVFLGQDEEFEDEFYDPAGTGGGNSTVGVEYQVRDKTQEKAYLFAGFKAGPKGKVGARYRYQVPWLDRNRFRFSEELFWIGGDGFGTLTRADIDRTLSSTTLLRWANKAEYSEESNGVEWNSRVSWIKRLGDNEAFRAFTFIHGETDPELLRSRGVGIGYRRSFLRDWLFWEVEPRYAWRKRPRDEDREGVAMINVRLEMIIGER